MISIVQNFICTQPVRLKIIEREISKMGSIFRDYPFYVNYNTSINVNEVESLYKDNIHKLNFSNDLTQDWGQVTLNLVNKVETKYLIILCEDFEYRIDYQEWKKIENEIIENRVSYMPIGRLWKYTEAPYHDFYDEGDRLWFYPASRSPGSSLSVDAFYETDTFKFKLLELKNHSSVRFPLNLPHHYEDIFHESKNNGVKNLGDIMCAIPKQVILMHEQPETETRLNK